MREVTKRELIKRLNRVIEGTIKLASRIKFKEDTITENLLAHIVKLFIHKEQGDTEYLGIKIVLSEDEDTSIYKYASFEAYKFGTPAEYRFGDILGIVCLGLNNYMYIGMFSLEAKRILNGRMDRFDYDQLIRLLRNNVFIKWVIYNLDKKRIDIVNPRVLLSYTSGRPKWREIGAFATPLNTYLIESLLNGNDTFMFIKEDSTYKYPPYEQEFNSANEMVEYYISRLERYTPPSYILTLNSHNNEVTFRDGLEVLQEIIMSIRDIFPDYSIEPIRNNPNNLPSIKPPHNPKPPSFGPSL